MRDPRILRDQCDVLAAHYRSRWTEDDRFRHPHGCVVLTPRRGQTRRTAATFTDPVHAAVDRELYHVRLYAGVALRQLPWRLRFVVLLALHYDLPHRVVAAELGCSERTVGNRLREALELVARMLWADDGSVRIPRMRNDSSKAD